MLTELVSFIITAVSDGRSRDANSESSSMYRALALLNVAPMKQINGLGN